LWAVGGLCGGSGGGIILPPRKFRRQRIFTLAAHGWITSGSARGSSSFIGHHERLARFVVRRRRGFLVGEGDDSLAVDPPSSGPNHGVGLTAGWAYQRAGSGGATALEADAFGNVFD
jgi:hypothetical protein